MRKDLNKYTYKKFLENGNIIKEYYDGKTKITICNNSIELSQNKEKQILIEPKTKKIKIQF